MPDFRVPALPSVPTVREPSSGLEDLGDHHAGSAGTDARFRPGRRKRFHQLFEATSGRRRHRLELQHQSLPALVAYHDGTHDHRRGVSVVVERQFELVAELQTLHRPHPHPADRQVPADHHARVAASGGHDPAREELRVVLNLARPRWLMPIHGAYRQLLAHARLGEEAGFDRDRIILAESGDRVVMSDTESIPPEIRTYSLAEAAEMMAGILR